MLYDVAGLILADDRHVHLSELTRHRAFAAVPFAGRYRLIDFPLSNMVNSGMTRVGVATSYKYKSLMDHLGTGSNWDLDRRNQGLHILPPYLAAENYYDQGDDLRGVLDFLEGTSNEYVLVSEAKNVFSTTFEGLYKFHGDKEADITILYNHDLPEDGYNIVLKLEEDGKVEEVLVNPPKDDIITNSLGVVLLKKELLIDIVSEAVSRGLPTLTIELVLKRIEGLKVYGYEYHEDALRVNSIDSYFSASMELFDPEVNESIFWQVKPIYTKVKDEAPGYISADSVVENSLVSDGCEIYGNVKDTILFRSTSVGENSEIDRSIIGQGSVIGKNVKLTNVIVDKDCVISDGTELQGDPEYPVLIGKGAVI